MKQINPIIILLYLVNSSRQITSFIKNFHFYFKVAIINVRNVKQINQTNVHFVMKLEN